MHTKDRVLFLTVPERARLACWLHQYEIPPPGLNRGRWYQLREGMTDYIAFKELAALMDEVPPLGIAMDVIRGNIRVTVSEREEVQLA